MICTVQIGISSTTKATTNCGGERSTSVWMGKTKNTQAVASEAACKVVAVRLAYWTSAVLPDLNQQLQDLKRRRHIASRRATSCPPPTVYGKSSTANSGDGCARTSLALKNLNDAATARGISARRETPCVRPPVPRPTISLVVDLAAKLNWTKTHLGIRKRRQTTG